MLYEPQFDHTWIPSETEYLVYLACSYDKEWTKITQKLNETLNQKRTVSACNLKYEEILKHRKITYYKKIVQDKNYWPNFEKMKVK